jgi:hypothetical protein
MSESTKPLAPALRSFLQLVVIGGFAAFIGFFSSKPAYRLRGDNEAIVKLSFSHAAQRKLPCRERSAAELAKLAPNMRLAQDCPRERSVVKVELDMDGRNLYRIEVPPGGLHKDGAATLYRRLAIPAGRHTFAARLSDHASGEFTHRRETTLDLLPGQVLLVDFLPAAGGLVISKG